MLSCEWSGRDSFEDAHGLILYLSQTSWRWFGRCHWFCLLMLQQMAGGVSRKIRHSCSRIISLISHWENRDEFCCKVGEPTGTEVPRKMDHYSFISSSYVGTGIMHLDALLLFWFSSTTATNSWAVSRCLLVEKQTIPTDLDWATATGFIILFIIF